MVIFTMPKNLSGPKYGSFVIAYSGFVWLIQTTALYRSLLLLYYAINRFKTWLRDKIPCG